MRKLTSILFAVLFSTAAIAQQQSLYFMDAIPQSRINPAAKPTNTGFFSIAPLAGINTQISLPGFTLDKFSSIEDNKLLLDLNKFSGQLKNNNRVGVKLNIPILSIGAKTGNLYWDFAVSVKQDLQVSLPKDLLDLVIKGNNNSNYLGQTADFSNLYMSSQTYTEIALGVSGELNDKIRWGFRPKLLFGIASAQAKFNQFDYYTDANNYGITINTDATLRTTLPLETTTSADGYIDEVEINNDIEPMDYIMKNMGLAADFGVHFTYTDKLEFDFAVRDLGYIKWTTTPTVLSSSGQFSFNGYEYDANADEDEGYGDELLEDVKGTFLPEPATDPYSSWLSTQIYLGSRYSVTNEFKVGGLLRTQIQNKVLRPAFTLSANYQPYRQINLSASYGIAEGSAANIGLGVAFNLGVLQIWAVSDNVLASIQPTNVRQLTAQFGINFVFGYKKKRSYNNPQESGAKSKIEMQ